MTDPTPSISILFRLTDGTSFSCGEIVSMNFSKNRYQPCTEMSAAVLCSRRSADIARVHLYIGSKLVHDGVFEYARREYKDGRALMHFRSRGFTVMLAQNEPVPGMNYDMDLTKLGRINTRIPNVTYQSGTDQVNYIYVKERSTIWDAVGAYSMKAYGTQPFIYGTNTVRVTKPSAQPVAIPADRVVTCGDSTDRRSMLSTVCFADLDGNYPYTMTSQSAEQLGIIRQRYYPFDRQWIVETDKGMRLKLATSARRCDASFVSYVGYSGEDLFTPFTADCGDLVISGEVHDLSVSAADGRIVTTLTDYSDTF